MQTARERCASRRHRAGSRRRLLVLGALLALALVVTACAAGPNPDVGTPASRGEPAGFWLGLWQGIILPVAFVVSLFNDHVNIYEVHNNGNWYDFGYVLGVGVFLGGGAGAGRSGRSRR